MHHSSGDSDGLRALFGKALVNERGRAEEFGATGEFPEGKLTENDEGEIRFGVANTAGKVVLDFGKPVAWLGMNPQQAVDLANVLISNAQMARFKAKS
jgi:hypothetical protein